jgi:hypothetical protein
MRLLPLHGHDLSHSASYLKVSLAGVVPTQLELRYQVLDAQAVRFVFFDRLEVSPLVEGCVASAGWAVRMWVYELAHEIVIVPTESGIDSCPSFGFFSPEVDEFLPL